ncbi:hypothetical protein WAK64_07100 [Bacillus spongiae]|uniref:MFS transporter n=1 Tax=Bacillus spongiae TaxID=2683610 RepID=A0ABU8HBY4_9BACI
MKKRNQLFIFVFLVGCITIGGLMGFAVIGKKEGEYPFELMWAALGGTIGGIFITLLIYFLRMKRKVNLPAIDERVLNVLKNYFLIVLYVVLFGSGVVFGSLFTFGVETIETGAVIASLSIMYIVIIVGAFVTVKVF